MSNNTKVARQEFFLDPNLERTIGTLLDELLTKNTEDVLKFEAVTTNCTVNIRLLAPTAPTRQSDNVLAKPQSIYNMRYSVTFATQTL